MHALDDLRECVRALQVPAAGAVLVAVALPVVRELRAEGRREIGGLALEPDAPERLRLALTNRSLFLRACRFTASRSRAAAP